MNLKPWREIAVPHQDVLKGTFQQAEFAADITRVHEGTATAEYQDPVLFFQRTFITEGMRLLLDSVVKRLAGHGGDPVIQLQTAFGGGKTHTMLAVYHLANGRVPASELQGIPAILNGTGIMELHPARIAVLDGIRQSANQPEWRGNIAVHTLWGELAWQLGGQDGYELVQEADRSGTSPGKAVLETLLARYAPCVILMDELVAYIRNFEDDKPLTGGTFGSNLSFIQALTEALKAVPTAILLASLPESKREAGSRQGDKALEALSHYFGRVQALWKPVSAEESFEIVRRRLFSGINDKLAMEAVCRSFADFYLANKDDLPNETQESRYYHRLVSAYPIHPEVFDRLYEDWSSLDNFQRTRGVLKLMAKVIHRLWKDDNQDPLIMPGNVPLYDADTRNDMVYYLPQGWDPVVEKDIDGERAETTSMENQDTRLGSVQACRRTARAIFMGSAPSTANQVVRGLELERVMLGVALPGQPLGVFKDALRRLQDRLHYLNSANNRFWFDTRPNLRKEMEERKRRFQDKEEVVPLLAERLRKGVAPSVFGGTHVFTQGGDVPDDFQLRLVVLPPDAAFSRSGQNLAVERAAGILKNRGEQPRFRQNRLIFLAAEYDSVQRLKDQVRSLLAWRSIVQDGKEMRITLDQFQTKQAVASLDDADKALKRMLRETYRWLLAPMQEARPGRALPAIGWEHLQVSTNTPTNLSQEIERVMKENEWLITEWAPIHLSKLLQNWFWKDGNQDANAQKVWEQMCQQLYMPRLKDSPVLQRTIAAGSGSRDFFGLAQDKKEDGHYLGFTFGTATSPILDQDLLLVGPVTAVAYAAALKAAEEAAKPPYPAIPDTNGDDGVKEPEIPPQIGVVVIPQATKRRFYGTIELAPLQAKKQFADIVEEVVNQFAIHHGVKVAIKIEIVATTDASFDAGLQRAVTENCTTLKLRAEFE